MQKNELDIAPIFLVGPHRSGTTWLAQAFECSPDIAYMSEPRHVWQWGHWFRPDDCLGAEDATSRVRSHIREVFTRYTAKAGRQRFCEKTPSNCLRIPFIHEIFPEGKIVFIIRDGRSVLRSTSERMIDNVSWDHYWQRVRLRVGQASFSDIPVLLTRLPFAFAKLRGRPMKFWGPRPRGWREWLEDNDLDLIIAKQWAQTVETALDDIERLPESYFMFIRYEDLVQKPEELMSQVLDFVGLQEKDSVLSFVRETADPSRAGKWMAALDPAVLEKVRPYMEPTMKRLGYEW